MLEWNTRRVLWEERGGPTQGTGQVQPCAWMLHAEEVNAIGISSEDVVAVKIG